MLDILSAWNADLGKIWGWKKARILTLEKYGIGKRLENLTSEIPHYYWVGK
jgi:hypothetical protein